MTFDRFYPIFDHPDWLKRLLPLGVRLVQLRLKDVPQETLRPMIAAAQTLCRDAGSVLVVNDHWQAAIDEGCDFIHLGQEDLEAADLKEIKANNIKLGVSTHSLEELDIALKAEPDYIALGPVYETILKKMKWAPQGLDNVHLWRTKTELPLIAIGGITPKRAPLVLDAGADSVAVVTDLVTAEDPEVQTRLWVEQIS